MLANAIVPHDQQQVVDDAQQRAVQKFVKNFLRTHRCQFQLVDGVLVASLPAALAAELGVGSQLRLCWDKSSNSNAEYITYGVPLLDRMLELASQRGQVCNLLCTVGLNVKFMRTVLTQTPFQTPSLDEPATFRRLCRTVGRFNLVNAKFKMNRRRIIHHLQLLFIFRVAFVSDEKQEIMVPILIDPLTEETDRLIGLDQTISLTLPMESIATIGSKSFDGEALPLERLLHKAELPASAYSIARCYQRASEALEVKLTHEFNTYSQQTQLRLNKELKRIDTYYNGLAQEVIDPLRKTFRRIATLSVRTQLARSFDTQHQFNSQLHKMKQERIQLENACDAQLQALEDEKQRRISELYAKYRTHMGVLLTNIAALRVPRVEYSLNTEGSITRNINFFYDVLRDRVLDLVCESCDKPLTEAYICDCGELVCPDCAHYCTKCGYGVCVSCAETRCHICAKPNCPRCVVQCPLHIESMATTTVCPNCAELYCSSCIRWQPSFAAMEGGTNTNAHKTGRARARGRQRLFTSDKRNVCD